MPNLVCYVTQDNFLLRKKDHITKELSYEWLKANGEKLSSDSLIEEVGKDFLVLAYNAYDGVIYQTKVENIDPNKECSECDGPSANRGVIHLYSVRYDAIEKELLSRVSESGEPLDY